MSFRLKTILGIALIEAVLLGILLYSGLEFLSSASTAEFEQRSKATALAYSVTAKNSLISSDLAELNSLTREMLKYPGVVYARVRDPNGDTLVQAGDTTALGRTSAAAADQRKRDDSVFDASIEVSESGTLFGKVEIGISVSDLQKRNAQAQRYGFAFVTIEMLAVALFSAVLGAYLTRQLRDLSGAAKRLEDGELGLQIPVRGSDELAQTAMAFNQMSTRLREGHEALAASERDTRLVLENIHEGLITLDRHGVVMTTSASVGSLFNLPKGTEVRGVPLAQLFPAQLRESVDRLISDSPGDRGILLEFPGDQGVRWLDLRISPIETAAASDRQPSLLLVVRDETQRVEDERELRWRGQIIDASSVGAVIADASKPELPLIDVNPAFERISGYAAAEIIGLNCRFLQGKNTDPQAVDNIRQALRRGEAVDQLILNYRKDGTTFWNDLRIMPLHDEAGQLTHFVALQNDVTERISTSIELERREAFLQRVLDATHDGIIVVDAQGLVQSLNAGAVQMFGVGASDILGRRIDGLLAAPQRGQFQAYLTALEAGAEPMVLGQEREFEAQLNNGKRIWVALRVDALDISGERRFIGVVHDITQRKLDEFDLRHAKEAAESAAHAKSDFLANMSHEIRTPLHGVLASMEMFRETSLNGQQRRLLDSASTSAGLLLGVIDEILDFSKLEAGKLRIESIEFDLRRTVEDVTLMLAQRAHGKRIELACFIAPEVPELVVGDPIRLRQVLVNLLGNAIKFTEHGEVVVSVSTNVAPDQVTDDSIRFEVRDTGIGISKEKQGTLFQPFMQADSSTSRRYGGSGLGLSIARRLVELMGGRIGLSSTEGAGSTFWFTLPAKAAKPRSVEKSARALAGVRALVVDDNSTNRVILHRYLTSWGTDPGSAASGEEALAKLQDAAAAGRAYDVVLLDLNMPVMDGYGVVRLMQSDPNLAQTPVLMLSSSLQDAGRLQGLRINVWLDKPVRQSDLYDALMTVLRERSEVASQSAGQPRVAFSGERILLVEDNPISLELGEQMLRRRGFEVALAVDGGAAVERVQRERFDAILMDIQMPGMDGYQATQAVREWERSTTSNRTPIIALTAHAQPSDREKCLAAGMDDYLVKPYSSEELVTTIARWLKPPNSVMPDLTEQVLDAHRLLEVRNAMGDAFPGLLGRVREVLILQKSQLQNCYSEGSAAQAREVAHSLKNSAGNVGAFALYELASEIEGYLAMDPPYMAPLDHLIQTCDATLEALKLEISRS